MRRSLLWLITLSLPFVFLGLLTYLLRDWITSLDWSSLKVGDFANLIGLGIGVFAALVAIGSLFVALAQFRQAIRDSEEQQKNLEASRRQLQVVAETVQQQQQTLTSNLETSRDLLKLQREQQTVLAKSLQTTKDLYDLQKQERERALELASRKPKIQALIKDRIIKEGSVVVDLPINKNGTALIPMAIKNIGSSPLIHPVLIAAASNEKIGIWIEGKGGATHPVYRSQLNYNLDFLPFDISETLYESSIHLGGPFPDPNFDITYRINGDNLNQPFKIVIHVRLKHE